MHPRRKKRLGFAIVLLGGVSAIIALLLYALNTNLDLFFTPSEIINGKQGSGIKPVIGQRIRVGGMVTMGSVKRDPQSLDIEFAIHDSKGDQLIVSYDDLLPDLFREGQGIVAQGILVSANKLKAQEVLAKHDENYMPPEVAEAMKQNHTQ